MLTPSLIWDGAGAARILDRQHSLLTIVHLSVEVPLGFRVSSQATTFVR